MTIWMIMLKSGNMDTLAAKCPPKWQEGETLSSARVFMFQMRVHEHAIDTPQLHETTWRLKKMHSKRKLLWDMGLRCWCYKSSHWKWNFLFFEHLGEGGWKGELIFSPCVEDIVKVPQVDDIFMVGCHIRDIRRGLLLMQYIKHLVILYRRYFKPKRGLLILCINRPKKMPIFPKKFFAQHFQIVIFK